jgi:hypothetical protein
VVLRESRPTAGTRAALPSSVNDESPPAARRRGFQRVIPVPCKAELQSSRRGAETQRELREKNGGGWFLRDSLCFRVSASPRETCFHGVDECTGASWNRDPGSGCTRREPAVN